MRHRCHDLVIGSFLALAAFQTPSAFAATLPAHDALSILIVADAVNPHNLSPEELTEPADLAPALGAADSGLNVANAVTVDSQCADEALTAIEGATKPRVVLYFAHRAAKLCGGGDAQTRLVAGLHAGLAAGMGIVVFHHGLYGDLYTPGAKDSLLALVGAEASGIAWDTTSGQRVFIVGGEHFVASNGLAAEGSAQLEAVGGATAGNYPYFDNVPDERYPTTNLLTEPGEERVALFATNSGGERLLGYALTRQGWSGRVVAYQPGEYQPNALDARAGNNFQILVNAIYFAALGAPEPAMSDTEPAPAPTASDSDAARSATEQSVAPPADSASATLGGAQPDESSVAPAPTTPGAPFVPPVTPTGAVSTAIPPGEVVTTPNPTTEIREATSSPAPAQNADHAAGHADQGCSVSLQNPERHLAVSWLALVWLGAAGVIRRAQSKRRLRA